MSIPFRGASGPSGLRPALGLSGVPGPALASLHRIPPEQPISHQLRRLTVSPLNDVLDLKADKLLDGTSNPLKSCCRRTRYDTPPRRSFHLTSQKESAVTKEQIDALLKLLDKPDVGMNDGDAVHKLHSTHLLVVSVPPFFFTTH